MLYVLLAQVTDHALQMAALHAEHAPRIVELARAAADTGEPINRPVWWADPADAVALVVDSGKWAASLRGQGRDVVCHFL